MFKCSVHSFTSEKIEEWQKHIEAFDHVEIGTAPCKLCGFSTEFKFSGKRKADSIPAICERCKKSL